MRWSLTVPGKLAAFAFIAASGAMNWMFMQSEGHGPVEGYILGAVSLAISVFAAILPFHIRRAVELRKFGSAAVGCVALFLFLSFSLLSAIGFAAMNRGAVSNDRDTLNASLGLVEAELKELEAGLPARSAPPAAAIEQQLAALRVHGRWASSRECTGATVPESRAFCEGYFKLKAELGAALASARKDQRRAELRKELRELRAKGAGQLADPRASLLAKWIGRWMPHLDFSDVREMLTLFLAVLVEFGAAFGLYLAAGPESPRGAGWVARKPAAIVAEALPVMGALPPPARDAKVSGQRAPERFEAEHARNLLSSIAGRA